MRCHLEDEQQVVFDEGNEEEVIEKQRNTELTNFFEYNKAFPNTDEKYVDFPKKFTWDNVNKVWKRRKRCFNTIGRVHSINPLAGDVFYLRLLLHHDHCKNKSSFKDLRPINADLFETYQEVCRILGLLQDDNEWEIVLSEGAATKMCPALRELFVTILMFCHPSNPLQLFEKYHMDWGDDFQKEASKKGGLLTEKQIHTMIVLDIKQRLQSWGNDLKTFRISEPTEEEIHEIYSQTNSQPVLIKEELSFGLVEMSSIAEERLKMFTKVIESVKQGRPLNLFIDARGGTGKTFVLNAILAAVRSIPTEHGGSLVLATGTTGKAANLLHLGRTFHARFKAVLLPNSESVCNIDHQSILGNLIRMTKIIIIDEAPMLHRYQLEALDRTLRDLTDKDEPFGAKILVLSGDFRQCLPVVPGASRSAIVDASLNRSNLWRYFEIMQFFPFFSSVATFSHRRSAQIKKLI